MKKLALFAVLVSCGVAAHATDTIIDQIGDGSGLAGASFGANQIFENSFASYNAALGDNINTGFGGDKVTAVDAAFTTSVLTFSGLSAITGWRVSFWANEAAAVASGNGFQTGAIATVDSNAVTYSQFGNTTNYMAHIGVNMMPGAATFVTVQAILNFTPNGQVYLDTNTAGYTPFDHNALGVNPGNGFGAGQTVSTTNDAALRILGSPVPEPTSMAALGLGALALAARRRRKA